MFKRLLIIFGVLLLAQGCAAPQGIRHSSPEPAITEAAPSAKPPPSHVPEPSINPSPSPTPEPSPESKPQPTVIKLQFAGDVLLHRGVINNANTGGNSYDFKPFFEALKPWIDSDLALCNMETPVDVFGDNKDISTFPLFNAPFEILEGLQYAGFNHLIHANNHVFDKGLSGLEATLDNFRRAGVSHTGTYAGEQAFTTPTVLDVNGIQVGILAYTDAVNGLETLIPADRRPFAVRRFHSAALDSLPQMAEEIGALREAGAEVVIVSLHWGAEYVDNPTRKQREIARGLCEAGADVIMGGHSHCVQPIEWYTREADGAKCLIMYSLGNFLADQTGREVPIHKTQYGMLVSLTVTKTPEGEVYLGECSALPTLCAREPHGGQGLRYTVMPLPGPGDAAVPLTVYGQTTAAWAGRAYEHVLKIVGGEFVG